MKILISGGGIAGMTAANFLHAKGYGVTVIDKAHEFTNVGFVLTLKSFGVDILKEAGMDTELRNKATVSKYVNFLHPNGNLIRKISYETINQKLTKSVMASRGDIHSVIYQSVKDKVKVLMNTTIERINQNQDKVKVTLSDKQTLEADLLIVAEGLRSSTRKIFFENATVEDFNIFYLAGRLKRKHNYELGVFKSFMGVKKMLAILPLTENEIALQCYIFNTDDVETLQTNAKDLLKTSFKDFDNEVQNLISDIVENGLLFSDKMGMVHAGNLVNGRVVLLGDAGYCPTALSGMGASLSVYGAKALSHFLEQNQNDISEALKHYNNCVQPVAKKFQANARKNAATFLPQSATKHFLSNTLLKIAPQSAISNRMSKELGLTEKQKNFEYN